jgi:hypothetical protein
MEDGKNRLRDDHRNQRLRYNRNPQCRDVATLLRAYEKESGQELGQDIN